MSNEPVPSHAPGAPFELTPKTVLLTIALMLGMIMQSLDATIANVALPHIQGSMSAAQDQVTWVLTSYVVMAGICTPLTGFLVMRYGRRRLFFLSVTCFTLASMLCGAAQSLEQIVLFRMLQGAAGAFLMPLSQAVVMDIYPKEKHTVVLSAWSMGILVAPILGPTIGSYLTETLSWRWAFYINFPFGLLSAVGAALLLSESKRDPHTKFDLLGFVLLGTAIAALQLMLDRGTTLDWFSSSEIVTEALLAALALYAFMAQMFTAAHPFLSRTAFKDTNYIIGLSIGFVFILVALGTSAILPTMFQSLMGYPVITTGLLLMPRGIGSFCTTAFVVRLMRHVDARV
ncbi:MAG: DHA2 family efflux MFS transporter permease subunit, partial [Rhodospirillaceae bacterium]